MYRVLINQYTEEFTTALDIEAKEECVTELYGLLNKINGARDMLSIMFFKGFDAELSNASDELYVLKQHILTKLNTLTGGDSKWIK